MGNQHPLNEKKGGLRSPTIRKLARDGTAWTPTEQVTRDKCLKQFCKAGRKGVEVSSGNSEAFQRGWDAAFGPPEAKARALAEIEAEKAVDSGWSCGRCHATGTTWESFGAHSCPTPWPPAWSATITGIDP